MHLSLSFSSSGLRLLAFSLAATCLAAAHAQPGHGHEPVHDHHAVPSSSQQAAPPYAGLQQRPIKALSPQQIAGLREGRGMGHAIAAELNGYPGPLHVLELEQEMALSAQQKAETTRVFRQMQQAAQTLGKQLIESEANLDRLFRERAATPEAVADAARQAAEVQGRLRNAHLQAHLQMMEILTADQVARYQRLRGYR